MAEQHLTIDDIRQMDRHYRANLINSLSGIKQAMLIGTQDVKGNTNLALFNSVFHLGADPALLGYVQRPVGVSGDSFRNISATGVCTFNHVHSGIMEKAHFTSARFPADVSEFEACHLTPFYLDGFAAPFVQESNISMGLELVEVIPVSYNDTRIVIVRILHVRLGEGLILDDGNLDVNLADSIAVTGLETYHRIEKLVQMPYAKVERLPDFGS
jgi:flavin reductase (DIM6/NTAB) family NADH-FMN oxidoreductase RutF